MATLHAIAYLVLLDVPVFLLEAPATQSGPKTHQAPFHTRSRLIVGVLAVLAAGGGGGGGAVQRLE